MQAKTRKSIATFSPLSSPGRTLGYSSWAQDSACVPVASPEKGSIHTDSPG